MLTFNRPQASPGGGGGSLSMTIGEPVVGGARAGELFVGDLNKLAQSAAQVITATTTITSYNRLILVDATAGPVTVSLPTGVGYPAAWFSIKKIDSSANAVTIDPSGAENIDGVATLVLTAAQQAAQIRTDGANWFIVSRISTQSPSVSVWAANKDYEQYDLVTSGTRLLRRIANGTSGATFDNTEAATWSLVSNDATATWLPNSYYYAGEMATQSGRYIQRITSGVSSATFAAFEAISWELVSSQATQSYGSSTFYFIGERVTRNGSVLERTAPGIGAVTFDVVEASKWNAISLGTSTFVATTYYYMGEKIREGGVLYFRVTAGVSGALFDAAEQISWRVEGENSATIATVPQTKTLSYSTSPTDGAVKLEPAANMVVTLPATLSEDKTFSYAGFIHATFTVTFTAGAGTTIVSPTTFLPVASFVMPGSTGQYYHLSLRRIGTVWQIT